MGGPIVLLDLARSSSSARRFVALNFAELASHFPVAGLDLPVVEATLEQDARLVHRLVLLLGPGGHRDRGGRHRGVRGRRPAGSPTVGDVESSIRPSPVGFTDHVHLHLDPALLMSTAINAVGVRLLTLLNNIGVATEILGMLVFAAGPADLRQQPADRGPLRTSFGDGPGSERRPARRRFLLGMFMSVFVVYGFDTAGTFGEETVDAGRQAPRGVLSSIWLSRPGRRRLPAGRDPVVQGHPGPRWPRARPSASRSPTRSRRT